MATGTTFASRLTRNLLIKSAYDIVGRQQQQDDPQYIKAVRALNALMREYDKQGEHLWAEAADPTTLTLSQDIAKYNVPTANMARLISVSFRNSSMEDIPVIISTGKQYNELRDKLERADVVERIYLSEEITLSSRSIFVHPVLASVNSQSKVTGTDALNYSCIRNNVGDTDNRPITGTNYRQFWEQVGSGGVAWVDGTSYTAPQLLVMKYARPLFDFTKSTDDPDIPAAWDNFLTLKLVHRLLLAAPVTNLAPEQAALLVEKRKEVKLDADIAEAKLFEKSTPQTDDIHNLTMFF